MHFCHILLTSNKKKILCMRKYTKMPSNIEKLCVYCMMCPPITDVSSEMTLHVKDPLDVGAKNSKI